jgi:tRNA-dihydrouridine synthase A
MDTSLNASPRRFCVAPMIDWTDRNCRAFHRMFTQRAWLYTEMITTGALLHGDVPRHLDFGDTEHPVALQLGGSEPDDLARAAKLGEQWGYDEINLNCGCPSERVQRGAFGACLMLEPATVADCVKAMRDAVSVPVTVKHRIGIDYETSYSFVRDFVGTVADAGCKTFIVHARNAVLKGLSPKQNREVPPLRYEVVLQLKKDFPALEIILNGGVQTLEQAQTLLQDVDGVMVGREAYQNPSMLRSVDRLIYGVDTVDVDDATVEASLYRYIDDAYRQGTPLNAIVRHILGWHRGAPGARAWRRVLSDSPRLARGDFSIFEEANAHLRRETVDA